MKLLWLLLLVTIVLAGSSTPPSSTRRCDDYERQRCNSSDVMACTSVVTCPANSSHHVHCFSLWRNVSVRLEPDQPPHYDLEVVMKGCWFGSVSCNGLSNCISNDADSDMLFCCCDGDFCNRNMSHLPSARPNDSASVGEVDHEPHHLQEVLLYALLPLLLLTIVCSVAYAVYRRRKMTGAKPSDDECWAERTALLNLQEPTGVEKLEELARGRFGIVWRGIYECRPVAVKVLSPMGRQDERLRSWEIENSVYSLLGRTHEWHVNVVRFVAAFRRYGGDPEAGEDLQAEYELWLLTEYCPRGSLYQYLKESTLTWEETLRIAAGLTAGLHFLHEEQEAKPAIAHRDLKSKNILLKDDMQPCLADFGLALVLDGGRRDAHGQVGTHRYMAPEVLEGAINFCRDAFIRIDMYACALVLWEVLSRTWLEETEAPGNYHLPFEEDIGTNPTIELIREAVVDRRVRPKLGEHWRKHKGALLLCETIEECWDQDAEARLSAGCVLERLRPLGTTALSDLLPSSTDSGVHSLGVENG